MAGVAHAGFGRIRQQYPLLLRPQAQRRKITGGRKYSKTGAPASTTRENARAPLLDRQEATNRFRRFARALTVRIQQATPLSRQRRTALPTKFYLHWVVKGWKIE